jgi:hypothetical protein
MDQITYAKFFAAHHHDGQRYGVLPYTHHLEAVERVLREFYPVPLGPLPLIGESATNRVSGAVGVVKYSDWPNDPSVYDMTGTVFIGYWSNCVRTFDDPASPDEMFVAAWLHDVVEDTDVKRRDIEELFGDRVMRLVESVTAEDGPNRKTRNALTYPKTRVGGAYSVRLKLADRIANVRNGGASVEMYQREYADFHRALYTQGENEDMWMYLGDLLSDV